MRKPALRWWLVWGIGLSCSSMAVAEDWPHWMGPRRDNTWNETEIIERFPEGGPKIVWRHAIAGGYAGPSVANGRVFVTDYVTGDDVKIPNFERKGSSGIERIWCLNEADGKVLWKHEYPVQYTISYPAGPRCTPVIDGDRVYTLGAEGHLFALDVATGKVLWSKHLPAVYQTKAALWGYAAHPLIDGNHLITLAGGNGTHVVALDKVTGEEVWRTLTSPEQGYSPPTIIEAAGKRQLILLRPNAISSVDPATGKMFWTVPYEATNGSIIMSPVTFGSYLYAAGYSNKSLLLELLTDRPDAEVVWQDRSRDAISPVNVQPFPDREAGILFGFDQSGELIALKLPEGKRLWSTTQPLGDRPVGTGTAFIVRQGTRYWMFTENGELVIAEMSAEGFRELDRAKVIEPTNVAFGRDVVWSMPAFANRHVYLRNDEEIMAIDLSQRSGQLRK